MHFNIVDVLLGGFMSVMGVVYLRHFRKQPDSPFMRKMRVLTLLIIFLGAMLALWDPMFALASKHS